jgi:Sigma-70, region 4
MASLDSLPPDQRAVLQLVLQRGRSYDQIAQMLSIDRAAVRERALSAFDALGPQTRVAPERRALITDYLLGQLPPRVADETRDRLGESPTERAWARVLASELTPLAKEALPEIPVDASRRSQPGVPEPQEAVAEPAAARSAPAAARQAPPDYVPGGPSDPSRAGARSSRRGGAILLGLGVLVVIVVLIVIISGGGSSKKNNTSGSTAVASTPAATTTTATTPATTPTTGTSTTAAKVIGQVNLSSPTSAKGTTGVAQVIQQGSQIGVVIVAQGIPANTKHDAYAVWLYNSASNSKFLGFVNPGVKADGKLQTAGVLPANASSYKELLVTVETQPKPAAPGKIVLQGAFSVA